MCNKSSVKFLILVLLASLIQVQCKHQQQLGNSGEITVSEQTLPRYLPTDHGYYSYKVKMLKVVQNPCLMRFQHYLLVSICATRVSAACSGVVFMTKWIGEKPRLLVFPFLFTNVMLNEYVYRRWMFIVSSVKTDDVKK